MDKLFIPVLLGTNREGRASEKVANFVVAEIGKRDDIETQLFDVRDFDFPKDNYGGAIKDEFPEYRDAVTKADGLIIVSPEYNRSYPGPLKSVLDLLYTEYARKAVGLVGVSSGAWGGTRVMEHLLPVVKELGLAATHRGLNFPNVGDQFDENGNVKDKSHNERAQKFLDELAWLAAALKQARG